MDDEIRCVNGSRVWAEADLDPVPDFWGRVEPGGVVPLGQCPGCGARCYPAYGYVHELEGRLARMQSQLEALHGVVSQLLEWAAQTGGWEAPVWRLARRVLARSRAASAETAGRGSAR